ncbi:RNA-directed DNA polymerase, eukaryota [Tanacetum coccineum]
MPSPSVSQTFHKHGNQDVVAFKRRLKEILIGDVRLIINRSKFFKDGERNLPTRDFSPLYPGPRLKAMINVVKSNRSFKDVVRGHQDQQPPKAQCIRIIEDNSLKSRLELGNVKYVGGLSLLFEWETKEVASQSLEANSFWLQQWFDDLKLWEDNGEAVGRLTLLTIEGLPILARNLGITTKIVFEDFNVVRSQNERFGCVFDTNEANSFNDFISRVGFINFPLSGRRFTRFDKNGSKASKLDRFLLSRNFFDYWNDASVLVLCHSLSDHCPLLLKVETLNFGPKPYRVFDKWFGNDDFKSLVVNSWTSSPLNLSDELLLF